MDANVVLATLKHIWTTLEPTGCPLALMGGLSLAFWRHVRSTQDVDVLIDGEPAGVEALLEALRQAGVRTKHQPPVIDLGSVRIVQLLYEPMLFWTSRSICYSRSHPSIVRPWLAVFPRGFRTWILIST